MWVIDFDSIQTQIIVTLFPGMCYKNAPPPL